MSKPWFDAHTGHLIIDEYITSMDSFKNIMEDNIITDDELHCQAEKVAQLLKQLEEALPTSVKELATEALCELAVLNIIQQKSRENVFPHRN